MFHLKRKEFPKINEGFVLDLSLFEGDGVGPHKIAEFKMMHGLSPERLALFVVFQKKNKNNKTSSICLFSGFPGCARRRRSTLERTHGITKRRNGTKELFECREGHCRRMIKMRK